MRLTLFLVFLSLLMMAPTIHAQENVQLLNSTLITKLHFDRTPHQGQMVGALQISFRNTTGAPITNISVLLNPGLNFERVVGPQNANLRFDAALSPVEGMDSLQLNAATIRLAEPLEQKQRIEIVIHYKGFLQRLSDAGLAGVDETLDPDFTMIRAQSFGYPVFAKPTIKSIESAWHEQQFQQVAFVEYPGSNLIAGSVPVASKTIDGNKTNVELRAPGTTGLLALAVAPYDTLTDEYLSVAYTASNALAAKAFFNDAAVEVQKLAALLGKPARGANLAIAELPNGYRTGPNIGNLFVNSAFFDAPRITAPMKQAMLDMWRFNSGRINGHWANGLDTFIQTAALGEAQALNTFRNETFNSVRSMVAENPALSKTPLADFVIEGFDQNQAQYSALAFALLYEIVGHDIFFETMKSLRTHLAGSYADMASVGDYLGRSLKNKQAGKFVKNWFLNGRSGKDLAKVDSFAKLVERYQ